MARMERYNDLYEEIRDNGYKTQSQLPNRKNTKCRFYDEVSMCVGRDGELLFYNGRHRFSIAMLLAMDSIPCQITVRHKKWQYFRDRIISFAYRNGGKVYAPLLHPDLEHIPSHHGHERHAK